MAKTTDERPRFVQIAAEIRAQIMSGDLAPGAQLPSTAQLVEKYNAANPTVQRALNMLKAEGFLYSRVGVGVYVRRRQQFIVDVAHYFAPSPGGYSYDPPSVSEVKPPADVTKALGIPEGDTAVLRHRLLRYDGEPVELSWSYYPTSLASGTVLESTKKIRGGAPQALADLGCPQRYFIDEVSVRAPRPYEVVELELPADVPVICQFRVIYTDDDRPVEVSLLVKGGHLYSLRYRQQIH